jgi:hypothetical protein
MANAATTQRIQQLHEEALDELFDVTQTNTPLWRHWAQFPRSELNHRQRTILGLLDDLNDREACELGLRIYDCRQDAPCGTVLCPHCRQVAQRVVARRLLDHFGYCVYDQVRFLTVLCDLSYNPIVELPYLRDQFTRDLRYAFDCLPTQPRVYGFYELDVKHPEFARSKRSREVLGELGMQFGGRQRHSYLLHLHAIVDLNGGDNEKLKRRLKDSFPGKYRVRCTHLWSSRTVTQNLITLGHYMTKTRLQYSDNLYGSSVSGKARYMDFYPYPVVREITHTMREMHGKNHFAKLGYNI